MKLSYKLTWTCLLMIWTCVYAAGTMDYDELDDDMDDDVLYTNSIKDSEYKDDYSTKNRDMKADIPSALIGYTNNWLQNYEQYHRVLQVGPVGFVDSGIEDDGLSIPIDLPNTDDEIRVFDIQYDEEFDDDDYEDEEDPMDTIWLRKRAENTYDNGSSMSLKSTKEASIAALSVAAAIAALICFV